MRSILDALQEGRLIELPTDRKEDAIKMLGAVIEALPSLRERYRLDFVVVNAENAAGGFGVTEQILIDLLDAGADVVTTGNHVFDQREALVFIERYDRLLRPINYPAGTPGKGAGLFKATTATVRAFAAR